MRFKEKIILCSICLFAVLCSTTKLYAQTDNYHAFPFSTNATSLTVWNGSGYVPITLKGINLGVAIPGTFPSELNVTYDQYYSWFGMMRAAGFNLIRLYTLHYPQFYKALKDFNLANPQSPLLIMHGVWLEEELDGYNGDLYFLSDSFKKEIQDNVNCVHGNHTIAPRLGKAYGTYTADVSKWNLGYIVGREVYPSEIIATNSAYPAKTSYSGTYLSISGVAAAEVFEVSMMDWLLQYEMTNYHTQRPVSFSSWPTLDPLTHPTETTTEEDKASINLSGIDFSKAKAGVFASYHAYPYYPDFISKEERFTTFADYLGQNSYLGYLTYLKAHYSTMPLIIAEFGVPSSWGIAHYAQSGMNHGGFDERQQGENNIRLFGNILEAGCGGGIMFSWIDEWFKRTWITDPMDFLMDRRILWQNITAAEQNFGLVGFEKNDNTFVNLGTNCASCAMTQMQAATDFKYFKLKINLKNTFSYDDSIWIALDTYRADLGESVLPNGKTTTNRAEFALLVTAAKAELYVTQAYDLYGIWHKISGIEQLFHSVATDGKPWRLVRWKNNQTDQEVQYIGLLKVNRLNLPSASTDGVIIKDNSIELNLPWTLINFVDPSTLSVMNDDRSTTVTTETAISDGISVTAFYKGQTLTPPTRFVWESWNTATNVTAYAKQSYSVVKEELPYYPGATVACADSFTVAAGSNLSTVASNGLLVNDYCFDGGSIAVVVTENPKQGILYVNEDGAFGYLSDYDFVGVDSFKYKILNGFNQSNTATVAINVTGERKGSGFVAVYPNPSTGLFTYKASTVVDKLEVYDSMGNLTQTLLPASSSGSINLTGQLKGHYFAKFSSRKETIVRKLILQ